MPACEFCQKPDARTFRYAEEDVAYFETDPDDPSHPRESEGGRVYACGIRHCKATLRWFLVEIDPDAEGIGTRSVDLNSIIIWEEDE